MTREREDALVVEDLSVAIAGQAILHGVALRVPDLGAVCVLGANGAGKTTLMRAVSGMYAATSGRVRLFGRDIAGRPSHEIARMGLAHAPEGRHVFPSMTVRENLQLGFGAQPQQGFQARLDYVLDLFPVLRERLGQRAGSLSGGEQQMLCIGRGLMASPRILLLDEPSLGLAPMVVGAIFALIRRIRADGTAVLLVEQNARAALAVSDHAYVMESGRLVLEGPSAELAADPRVAAAYLGGA